MTPGFLEEAVELADGRRGGGIEIAGVFQPQDDHLQTRITDDLANLLIENIGGSEEQITLSMHDGNARHGTARARREFGEVPLIVEVVFDQFR